MKKKDKGNKCWYGIICIGRPCKGKNECNDFIRLTHINKEIPFGTTKEELKALNPKGKKTTWTQEKINGQKKRGEI